MALIEFRRAVTALQKWTARIQRAASALQNADTAVWRAAVAEW